MTEPDPVPVVVVGAGPTGVLAATLLAQQGVSCLLLERWTEVYDRPRAVHLDDEVYRLLGRIGVADAFAAVSRPALGLRLLDREHRLLAEFARTPGAGRHGYPQANMFDQPELERLLRDNLRRFPSARLRLGVDVTAVRQDGDGPVLVEVEDRETGRSEQIRAAYVLGCDGARSAVREAVGARLRDLGFVQRWLVVDVATDADLQAWDGVHQVCDTERAATFMRIGPDRYRWEFQLLDGESAHTYDDLARLLPLIAPWTGTLPADRLRLLRVTDYVFRAQLADRWRDRRVFLLGDAAHLTPPFIGQGMGAGLRDAANLAWKLAGVLAGELDEAVLDSYQAERAPHAEATIRLAVLIGRAMTAGGRSGDLLRRTLAPRLHLVPGLRARVLDSATPRLHRSALVRRRRWSRGPAGRLVPNAPLPAATLPGAAVPGASVGPRRIDELAPSTYVVVSARPVPTAVAAELDGRGVTTVVATPGTPLRRWLQRSRTGAVLVRPDGTVLAGARSAAGLLPAAPRRRRPAPVG